MRFKALLVTAAVVLSAVPAMAAGYGEFTGDWRNEAAGTGSITRVRVMPAGGGLKVRVWGQCSPSDCDWGSENAVAYSSSPGANPASSATDLTITFNPGHAQTILILRERPGDSLTYSIYTRFTDGSGRRPYVSRGSLRKHFGGWPGWPPGGGGGWPGGGPGGGGWPGGGGPGGGGWPGGGGPGGGGPGGGGPGGGGPGGGGPGGGGGLSFAEDCIGLNWNNVQAQHVGGEWKVVDGSHWILSFGARAAAAQRAANTIRHYRFTHTCYIGRPNASMTYWKRGNGVPSGGMPGDDCNNNNPDTTEARWTGGAWKLVDGSHWLLHFGGNEAEARKAEQVVRHYRLNQQCFVERPNPGMSYWLSE